MAAVIKVVVTTEGISGIGDIKKEVTEVGEVAKKSSGGFDALGTAGKVALAAVATAAVAATAAVGKFIGDSISLAGDFESGMNNMSAALGKGFEPGTEALGEFKDLFITLGKELPVSTQKVQDAAIALVKGGLDPAVVQAGALKDSLNFAAAAGMELADAAELTIKQLGTFVPLGASVEEQTTFMANAQNLLVKAAGASTLDVDKLGDAMLQAGGAAKASGVEYQDFVTVMGLISPAFGSASEAGTSYKNFLSRLIPTTDSATAWMQELGLATADGTSKFYDSTGAFIGNAAAAQLLNETMGGLSDATRAEAMSVIFGNDAKGAAIALMAAGAEGYDAFAQKMNEANGVQQQAAAVQQGFNYQIENMKGSLEALQITIGSALLPVLADLIGNYITPGINAVMAFTESTLAGEGALGGIAAAIADAGVLSVEFADAVGYLASQLGLPGQLVQDLTWSVISLITSFQSGGESAGVLGSVLADLSIIWQNVLSAANAVMDGYMAIASAILPVVTAFWQEHGEEIMAFIQSAYKQIVEIINTAIELYKAIVPPILQAIAGFIASHGDQIVAYLSSAWKIISGVIDAALAIIQGVLKTALALIRGDWEGAWNAIKEMSARVVQDILQVLEGAVSLFRNATQMALDAILGVWNSFADWAGIGGGIIDGIIEGIVGGVGALVDAVTSAAQDALDAAKDALGISSPSRVFADTVGEPIVTGIMAGIKGMTPALIGAADQMLVNLFSATKKLTSEMREKYRDMFDDLVKDIEGLAEKASDVMADSLLGVASLDRAKARAIAALDDISEAQRQSVEQQLKGAADAAAQIADPQQAAKFFKAQSDQIFELAKLRDEFAAAEDETAKARIQEQFNLIAKAQEAEMQALGTQMQASPLQDMIAQIQGILATPNLPSVLDPGGGALGQLFTMLTQLTGIASGPTGGSSSITNSVSRNFTYAPSITTTGGVSGRMDYATAKSLAGV